jgi:hypothetical protein
VNDLVAYFLFRLPFELMAGKVGYFILPEKTDLCESDAAVDVE